jgi:hypothetical protein
MGEKGFFVGHRVWKRCDGESSFSWPVGRRRGSEVFGYHVMQKGVMRNILSAPWLGEEVMRKF